MRFLRSVSLTLGIAATAALLMPGVPSYAAYNFPTVFGPITGDCTTSSNTSVAINCTKSNGNSFASMAFQTASSVVITGGSIDGTVIGATTRAAINATTGAFNGLVTGVGNTFTGLSTQTGGHIVGTADLTGTATLTPAQEDVCANFTAAGTITLPPSPAPGQRATVTDCTGTAATAAVTVAASTGQKILTSTGPAQSLTYGNNYQSASYTYHATGTLWTIE